MIIQDWANDNVGFISLLSLSATILLIVLGWVTGFFKNLYRRFRPTPSIVAAAVSGAKYPREITFRLENLTEQKILIYAFKATNNVNTVFETKTALPFVLKEGEAEFKVVSDASGSNYTHQQLDVKIEFGFVNAKKYSEYLVWEISNGSINLDQKYVLPPKISIWQKPKHFLRVS